MRLLHSAKSDSFFSQSLFIFLIRFFPVLASVLATIYYARQLPVDINGKYISFWAQLPLVTSIACAGIHAFLLTYKPATIVALFRKVSRLSFSLYAIWVLASAFVFAAMQTYSGLAGFATSFLFLIVYALSTIAESFLIVARRFRFISILNVLYAAIFFLLHWYVLSHSLDLNELFTGLLVLAAGRFVLYIGSLYKAISETQDEAKQTIDFESARNLWLHMMFYDVSQLAFKWIDKILISLLFTASVSAIYFNGSNDVPFLPLILSAVGSAALINLAGNNENDAYAVQLILRSARILSSVVFPVFFFLLFFRYEMFEVIITKKYEASVPIFLAAILVVPLRACNFTTVLQNRHMGRIINIGAAGDILIACLLMYPLYLLMGLPGIALAFTLSTYLQAAYYLYHTARTLHASVPQLLPLRNWLVKLIVFFLLFIIFHYLAVTLFSPGNVLILGCVLVLVSVLVTLRHELKKQDSSHHAAQVPLK